jgi:hypothetical protein
LKIVLKTHSPKGAWLAHIGMEIHACQGELVHKLSNQPNLVIVGRCLEFEANKKPKIIDIKLAFWYTF